MTNRQKAIKLEIVSQPKHKNQVERNWLDLPSEVTANILNRIGVVDILESAEKVCTAWHEICKDPAMWRVLYLDASSHPNASLSIYSICRHAVDRSQGQLVDITMVRFGTGETLKYIANRSSQLKRLTIAYSDRQMYETWVESLMKFPLLEELSLYQTSLREDGFEAIRRYCPMLKTLKLNIDDLRLWNLPVSIDKEMLVYDEIAIAIGKHLHDLRHLELIGSTMSNKGLEMILDGCPHLELLDLRACWLLNLDGDLGRRCLQQIRCVKLPKDSLEGCPYLYKRRDIESEGGS